MRTKTKNKKEDFIKILNNDIKMKKDKSNKKIKN